MSTPKKRIVLKIEPSLCKGCELCINTCNKQLLKISEHLNSSGFHYPVLTDHEKCNGCGCCFIMCPDLAIQIWTQ